MSDRSVPPSSSDGTLPSFLSGEGHTTRLSVRVIPRAGRTTLAGDRSGALVVRLAAAPVDGAANAALIDYLAGRLRLPRQALTIIAGDERRDKRLSIEGLAPAEVARRLTGPV